MPRRTGPTERLWFSWTKLDPEAQLFAPSCARKVSTKKPRSSAWTSGSIRTRSSISVGRRFDYRGSELRFPYCFS